MATNLDMWDDFCHEVPTVADDDQPSPEPKPPMHVKVGSDDAWHRVMLDRARPRHGSWRQQSIGLARTACNVSIGDKYYATREESYEGKLCQQGCFTQAELACAEEQRLAALEQARQDLEEFERQYQESARERAADRERQRRELNTFTGKVPKLDKPPDEG